MHRDVPPDPEVVPQKPEGHPRQAFPAELGDEPLALVEPDSECAVLGRDEEYPDLRRGHERESLVVVSVMSLLRSRVW